MCLVTLLFSSSIWYSNYMIQFQEISIEWLYIDIRVPFRLPTKTLFRLCSIFFLQWNLSNFVIFFSSTVKNPREIHLQQSPTQIAPERRRKRCRRRSTVRHGCQTSTEDQAHRLRPSLVPLQQWLLWLPFSSSFCFILKHRIGVSVCLSLWLQSQIFSPRVQTSGT